MATNTALRSIVTCIALWLCHGHCALDLERGDDSDLTKFVTRPDIKAPVLHIQHHDTSSVSPGYYFASPYAVIYQQKPAPRCYEACQTGPTIYDHYGNLVWSGACDFKNRNIMDFRSTMTADGTFVLSGIDMELFADDDSSYGDGKTRGQGFVLDDSYQKQSVVHAPTNSHNFNMQELRLVDDGRSALQLVWKPEYLDVSHLSIENRTAGWVGVMGFRETAVASGTTLFEWWSLPNVDLAESTWPYKDIAGPAPDAWDYFHADAVDKTPEGDYLLSARHTDCVYKISGQDGTIVWRLGGKASSFELDETVKFSRQHDVRSVRAESLGLVSKAGEEYVALFNNAGDELDDSTFLTPSSALVLRLEIATLSATTVRHVKSPSKDSVSISGNSQILPNGNTLVTWGAGGSISEHDPQGHLVAEARFASDRFSTYRTYKLDWQGQTDEAELVLKCTAWGISADKATTVCHASWNGATEVRSWRFIASYSSPSSSDRVLGFVDKEGFETKLESKGYSRLVHVEALDRNGLIIGTSTEVVVSCPKAWTGPALSAVVA